MDIRNKVLETYMKYDKKIRDAHMKIVQIEKVHKNRNHKEDEDVLQNILDIIEEVANDN